MTCENRRCCHVAAARVRVLPASDMNPVLVTDCGGFMSRKDRIFRSSPAGIHAGSTFPSMTTAVETQENRAFPGEAPPSAPNARFSDLAEEAFAKTMRAAGTGTGKKQTRVGIRDFSFISDSAEVLGGRDEGPTPMEYLAGAVNACTTVVVDGLAQQHGIETTAVQTYTIAKQDTRGLAGKADVQPYMYAYRLQIVIETETADPEVLTAFAKNAEHSCPAINLLRDANTGSTIVWSFVREAGEGAAEALSNTAWGYETSRELPDVHFTIVNADLVVDEAGGAR